MQLSQSYQNHKNRLLKSLFNPPNDTAHCFARMNTITDKLRRCDLIAWIAKWRRKISEGQRDRPEKKTESVQRIGLFKSKRKQQL